MGAAIGLREDFGGGQLRALARTVKDAGQARRLLALAVIYDGGRRTEAAKIGSVGGNSRLGAALQRPRPGRTDRRQGAGKPVQAER